MNIGQSLDAFHQATFAVHSATSIDDLTQRLLSSLLVLVPADGVDEDELVLAAADAGADDVERDGSTFVVTSPPEELARVREALESAGLELESAGLSMVPKTTVAIADEPTAKQVVRLVEGLEESDDVQDVYANFDIPEAVLEAVAG